MGDWPVREFTPFGIHSHLQNWMLILALIVVAGIVMIWRERQQ
jgi:hypothetical protein